MRGTDRSLKELLFLCHIFLVNIQPQGGEVVVIPSRLSAFDLTATTAVSFINVKYKMRMTDNEKKELNACIENAESVQEFLEDWYSTADLYETAANATNVLLQKVELSSFAPEEKKYLTDLLDQHLMMTNLLKKFEKGGTL